jgi:hypothetical protein
MKEELLKTADEFLESGIDDLAKQRFNVASSDFFKAIVIFCDYLIYDEVKILPKNHRERFSLLELYFKDIYKKVSSLFKTYTKSYNFRLALEDANKIKEYAYELKKFISSKK